MRKKTKITFRWITIILLGLILLIQYKINYDINKEPPSLKWSKSKKIANVKLNCSPKILKKGNNFLLAMNDKNKLNILEINDMGDVLKSKKIVTKDEIINDISFMEKGENYFISWDTTTGKGNKQNYIEIDKNLNKIREEKVTGVNESFQVDDKVMLRTYDDKVEALNLSDNSTKSLNVKDAKYVRGIKLEDNKYLLIFITQDGYIKSCEYKDGEMKNLQEIAPLNLTSGQVILDTSLGFDNKYAYLMMFKNTKVGFYAEKFSFELNNLKKYSRDRLDLPNVNTIKNMQFVSNEEGKARFLASVTRNFGIKKQYDDVLECYLLNNKIKAGDFISKSRESSSYAAVNDKIAIYGDYIPESESYNIYFTSENEKFKNQNNKVRHEERTIALQDTVQGFMYALVYIIVMGLKWILPSVVVMGIVSFFEYKLKPLFKKILFIGISIVTFFIKFQAINTTNYKTYYYYLPKQLSSVTVGFSICFMLSAIFYIFGYLGYKDDLDVMPIAKFMPYLMLDSVATLMVFAPYML